MIFRLVGITFVFCFLIRNSLIFPDQRVKFLNHVTPNCDHYLISSHGITDQSNIKVVRKKEGIKGLTSDKRPMIVQQILLTITMENVCRTV